MDIGWLFLIACLIMMVLCFFIMGRRACSGGCVCMYRERWRRPSEENIAGENTEMLDEANRPVPWKRDPVPPGVPR